MILLPARSRSFASAKAGPRRAAPGPRPPPSPDLPSVRLREADWIGRTLLVAIAVALVFDVLEGVSPPADADSLTYHFALPKQFLAAGRLEFVPRAGEGVVLLPQMTYLLALGLGGEIGLTLWTMVSSWMVSALLFVICRRYLGLNWSLAAALLFLTTPAVLYGGGTGQVEARLALFALAGAFAVSDAVRTGRMGYAVLAGLMAGFFAGGKYFGLLFAAACAVPLLARRGWFRRTVVYGLAVLGAGSQWYGWNLYHTGDPIFPGLYAFLDIPDSAFWDQEHNAYFWNVFVPGESSVPVNLLWYLTYPFQATFGRVAVFESGRTGFGPYGLLVLPFAVAGVWRFRRRLLSSPLAAPAAITLVFYTLWFFSGASQHIRHLLPVYTVLVVCLTVAASRWAEARTLVRPLAAAAGLAILVQLGGAGVVGLNYARYVFSDESREDFLRRNVGRFAPVPWINANLTENDRILLVYTPLVYLLEVPHYSAHVMTQILVDHTPRARDPKRFLAQLKALGITHLLLTQKVSPETGTIIDTGDEDLRFWTFAETLRRAGCLTIVKTFETRSIGSRTLAAFQPVSGAGTGGVLRLETEGCRL
ncbi:MAG: glycosyltransferase family 39 protein [Proteobacteria bacterium]|nr:glycosyltransferase family 39 protein [Pseudomonadota bacterium]